jgi:GcrA cell cycle regulator
MAEVKLWTDDEDKLLAEMYEKGLSASQIAKKIPGRSSRNAIIGRIHRLKLPPRAPRPVTGKRDGLIARPSRSFRQPQLSKEATRILRELAAQMKETATVVEKPDVAGPVGGVALLDLTPSSCRWPINSPPRFGEFRFCGAHRAEGRPYCQRHADIAYTPLHGRKRREMAA